MFAERTWSTSAMATMFSLASPRKLDRPRPPAPIAAIFSLLLGALLLPAPAYTVPASPQATVVIEPSTGPPGTRALVRGSFAGYGPLDFVSIYWDTLYSGRRLGGNS